MKRIDSYINPYLALVVLILFLVVMFWSQHARSQELPGGVTCEQVRHYAGEFNIPNTTLGRVRARIIAAALGIRITSAQLDAAARCLSRRKT